MSFQFIWWHKALTMSANDPKTTVIHAKQLHEAAGVLTRGRYGRCRILVGTVMVLFASRSKGGFVVKLLPS
jgi:hypothetical protein